MRMLDSIEWANILGCPVTKLDLEGVLAECERFIADGKAHYVAVVNAAKIVKMRSDPRLDGAVRSADIIGADGMSVVWAGRILGDPLPGRVNGTDLMYRLLERSNTRGYGVYFLGATSTVLNEVISRVRLEYPGVRVAGFHHGYFSSLEQEEEVVSEIRKSGADVLFIAFGTPKKEFWAASYLEAMGVPVVHGVGGSFDVFAGVVPRAPAWMQSCGLEWFFRLLREPRRLWKRYATTNSRFIAILVSEWLSARGLRRMRNSG